MTRFRAFALAALSLAVCLPADGLAKCKVLALGDSNTWGSTGSGGRHGEDVRWPSVLGREVPHATVIEEGRVGRRTDLGTGRPLDIHRLDPQAPLPPLVAQHMPLDLVVIMLGTNDLQNGLERDAATIARSAFSLGEILQRNGVGKALVVTPPPLKNPENGRLAYLFSGAQAASETLHAEYLARAQTTGLAVFDAGSVVHADGADGVHLSAKSQIFLAQALAPKVVAMLGDCSNRNPSRKEIP